MVLVFLATGFLTGCSRRSDRADLVIINGKEVESLDPAIITGQPDIRIALTLFEGLTRYNAVDAQAEPGLADRWEISPDLRTYTFHLRTNGVWSTGEPITAEDVVYSWLRVLNPLTAADYAGNFYYIKNAEEYNTGKITNASEVAVKALDRWTVQVELLNPTPFFLELCAFQTHVVMPRWIIEKHGDRWIHARPLPSSGAYELLAWRLEDRVSVRKNPRYWDAANVQLERVDLMPVNSPATALNLFLTKQVDIIWDKDVVPTELIDLLKKRRDFHVFDYLGSYFVRFNVTRKPFDDVRVRKAFALVVDRQRITERVTRGGERPASFLVPPGLPNYQSPAGLGYDPGEARRLLKEAGYPDGKGFPRVSYHFNTSRSHEMVGVELQEMWRRELGIEVELRSMEWKTYLRAQSELDFDLSRSAWVGDYNDPNTFLDMFRSSNPNNRTGWKNLDYDQWMRKANASSDPAERAKFLSAAEALLVRDDPPILPLYIYVGFNLFDPDVITGLYNNIRDEHPVRSIKKRARSTARAGEGNP